MTTSLQRLLGIISQQQRGNYSHRLVTVNIRREHIHKLQ